MFGFGLVLYLSKWSPYLLIESRLIDMHGKTDVPFYGQKPLCKGRGMAVVWLERKEIVILDALYEHLPLHGNLKFLCYCNTCRLPLTPCMVAATSLISLNLFLFDIF